MIAEKSKRKVTAILIADVKGYSRLLGEDESWAVRTLGSYKEIMIAHIQEHRGRFVEAVGDNLLAEFASAVDAVQCAVEIQQELKIRNGQLPENRRMEFRIGVNLGDVVEEGDKIFGDGVLIAAKMESLAAAGGLCISGAAYNYVKKKLVLGYEYLGEQSVKNMEKPVRVYRVLIEPKGFISRLSIWKRAAVRQWERLNPLVKVIVALVVVANGVWQIYPSLSGSSFQIFSKGKWAATSPDKSLRVARSDSSQRGSKEKMALPDLPSIAVLPFVNMSKDPDQEFLCDGMTENIITALSKVPQLFVISRQSTFSYKGKSVKVKQVSEELGVRYVLEGSFQKSGDRIRINAQLIDALTGNHFWAERYDRDLKDIFALQDEITLKIIIELQVKLTAGEMAHVMAKGAKNIDAFIKYMQAVELMSKVTKEGKAQAKRLLEEAIALDPEYPRLYVGLAWTHLIDIGLATSWSPDQSLAQASDLAYKAISLDDSNAAAYSLLGEIYAIKRQYEQAIAKCERAVSLEPNSAENFLMLGSVLTWAGRAEEAIPYIQKAIRINPLPGPIYFIYLAAAYRDSGQYEKAIEVSKIAHQQEPNNEFPYVHMAISYIRLGREEQARAAAAEILRINPKFSLERYAKILPFTQPVADGIVEDLRKAGLK